jgi:hypothetical protein
MNSEDFQVDNLILRIVQIFFCLIMVFVLHGLGQYIPVPEIYKGAAEKYPGKPALILSLDKFEYSIGEPIIFRNLILNDGNTRITFPVTLGSGELGYIPFFQTSVILTNEKGEELPIESPLGEPYYLPLPVGIVTVQPHDVVPCFGCMHNLLDPVSRWGHAHDSVIYKNALKIPGNYYLQTIYINVENPNRVRIIQGNGVSYLTDSYQNIWKSALLSNRVKFEIKP